MNQLKISMQDKIHRSYKQRSRSLKESVDSTRVPNTECENTRELPLKSLFADCCCMEEKNSYIYDSFNNIETSTKAYTPPPNLRFRLQPREVLLDTECSFLTTSFESQPVKIQKRKLIERGVYKVWHKAARQRHSDISDSFIDHYRNTYKNAWVGMNQGIKEIVPLRLHPSAIAEHKWSKISTHSRARTSHYEPLPVRKPVRSDENQPQLLQILENLLDTEKALKKPKFSVENLRRVKSRFRRSLEQHKENIVTTKAAPIFYIESSPTKSRDLERVLIPSSKIEI